MMASDDFIVKNEFLNDGGSIHIYYLEKYKDFVAFGFSAFMVMRALKTKEISVQQGYSKELQMPMVIIGKKEMEVIMRDGVIKQGTVEGKYYHLQSFIRLDEAAYDEWAKWLRGVD